MVSTEDMEFHCIGESGGNVGITAMRARRLYENPDEVDVFATVANYGAEPVTTDVQLSVNDNVRAVKSVTVPAAQTGDGPDAGGPGKMAVNFAVLTVRQLNADSLASDDAAWAVLAPPKRLSVLLVTAGNKILELALKACPLAGLDVMAPGEFDANDVSGASIEDRYDVVVLDNHVPAKLPKCRYLVFGRPPNNIDVSVAEELEAQIIVDWRPKHAVLKYVSLTNLFAQKCYKVELPRDAEVLAEFNESPALAIVRRNGSVFLIAAFDVMQSTWPFEPSFVLFCYNAANFLGMQVGQNQDANLQVGDPLVMDGLGANQSAFVDGPGFSDRQIKASSGGSIRYPRTEKVGVYGIRAEGKPARLFAVNLLDAGESNIEPQREIVLSGKEVKAEEEAISRANLPLWPFLVGLVLFLACLEWLVYNHKVRV